MTHWLFQTVSTHQQRAERWILDEKHATYGLAASRILVGIAATGILVANFQHRHVLWGPASDWIEPLRRGSEFGPLLDLFDGGPTWFTIKYLLLLVVAVAFTLGWRTRIMNLLLLVGLVALVERNGLVGDQGDNIARIGLLLLLFMDPARHWSLDARRRATAQPSAPLWRRMVDGGPILPSWLSNALHNVALIALALQLFILYTASALFKLQGESWQNGTALYYPLSLHEYAVFPWLNTLLIHNSLILMIGTYVAVFVQLYFAIGLLHPITRRLVLLGVIMLHAGIAVMMGLPWFSLSMLAFDAIFVSTATFLAIEAWLAPRFRSLFAKARGSGLAQMSRRKAPS
nr:HTTM domain-containing protein [uncultured Aeromicrobium sp.]